MENEAPCVRLHNVITSQVRRLWSPPTSLAIVVRLYPRTRNLVIFYEDDMLPIFPKSIGLKTYNNKNSLLGYLPVTFEKSEIGSSSREICEIYRAVVIHRPGFAQCMYKAAVLKSKNYFCPSKKSIKLDQ